MNKQELSKNISACNFCGEGAVKPFSFPIRDQEVMLISAMPSLQAMYKPLTSIRFFRHICLALFGDKYLREKTQAEKYLREFCDGNIYWTHYRKCYLNSLTRFEELDDICANKFLADELRVLKPKIIIVLGNEIHNKVRPIIDGDDAKKLFLPFPALNNMEEFANVRQHLSNTNRFVKKCAFAYSDGASRYNEESSQRIGHSTHLRFELDAFERVINCEEDTITTDIDELWYRNLVVPNMRRCAQLVQTYSFIEQQIKVLLSDYFVSTGNFTVLRKFRSPKEKPELRRVLDEIQEKWLDPLVDYVKFVKVSLLPKANYIKDLMFVLNSYRNAIVHGGGLMTDRVTRDESLNGLNGIYSFSGTVFLSAVGEETLKKLAREATNLLCEL